MARSTGRGKRTARSRRRRVIRYLARLLFWAILILETLWLAGFIVSTGSWLPPGARGLTGHTDRVRSVWTDRREEKADQERIERLLESSGSRGASDEPPPPSR